MNLRKQEHIQKSSEMKSKSLPKYMSPDKISFGTDHFILISIMFWHWFTLLAYLLLSCLESPAWRGERMQYSQLSEYLSCQINLLFIGCVFLENQMIRTIWILCFRVTCIFKTNHIFQTRKKMVSFKVLNITFINRLNTTSKDQRNFQIFILTFIKILSNKHANF